MALSLKTRRVLASALANNSSASEVNGAIGAWGGFQVNADASLVANSVQGDFSVSVQSGIETGSYQLRFADPKMNAQVLGFQFISVQGFTPRAAQTAETCEARVTGYNKDANGQWYISVQIATISGGAINPTPPAGFVIGVEAKLQMLPVNIL